MVDPIFKVVYQNGTLCACSEMYTKLTFESRCSDLSRLLESDLQILFVSEIWSP